MTARLDAGDPGARSGDQSCYVTDKASVTADDQKMRLVIDLK